MSAIASRLIGVWKLGGYAVEQEGEETTFPFGTKPEGFLICTREGFVSAQLMKPGRFPFQSKDWNQGTPDEFREAGSGYIAYCGVYEVNEEKETVTHIPFVALLPNLIKENQLRFVAFSAEMLTLRAVGVSVENGIVVTSRMDWKRAGC